MTRVYVLAQSLLGPRPDVLLVEKETSYKDLYEGGHRCLIDVGLDQNVVTCFTISLIGKYMNRNEEWYYRTDEEVRFSCERYGGEKGTWKESHGGTSRNMLDSKKLAYLVSAGWDMASWYEMTGQLVEWVGDYEGKETE